MSLYETLDEDHFFRLISTIEWVSAKKWSIINHKIIYILSQSCPIISEAITEHSICHPGLPIPQGDSHAGSPGFEFFHRAKSDSDLFSLPLADAKLPDLSSRIYQDKKCFSIFKSSLQGYKI